MSKYYKNACGDVTNYEKAQYFTKILHKPMVAFFFQKERVYKIIIENLVILRTIYNLAPNRSVLTFRHNTDKIQTTVINSTVDIGPVPQFKV